MDSRYAVTGIQDKLKVYEDKLELSSGGSRGKGTRKTRDSITILFSEISGIKYKKGNPLANGYLVFTLFGQEEFSGGLLDAVRHENSFLYASKFNEIIIEIKDFIESNLMSGSNQIQKSPGLTQSPKTEASKGNIANLDIIFTIIGIQDEIRVYKDKIELTPKGVYGFLNKGLKGTKTIPFISISGIQHKKAGKLTSGYLQFTLAGGNESKGGLLAATKDENTFLYTYLIEEQVQEIKDFIEKNILGDTTPNESTEYSIVHEIEKLADLRKKGILSEDEFKAAKSKLLE